MKKKNMLKAVVVVAVAMAFVMPGSAAFANSTTTGITLNNEITDDKEFIANDNDNEKVVIDNSKNYDIVDIEKFVNFPDDFFEGPVIMVDNLYTSNDIISMETPVHNLDTGLNYTTIQGAIDASETLDGHTILVDAGIYYENVLVTKSLALKGVDRDTTIIDAGGSKYCINIGTGVPGSGTGIANGASISDFTGRNGDRAAFRIVDNSYCSIINCTVYNVTYGDAIGQPGIYVVWAASNNIVKNCEVYNCDYGIYVYHNYCANNTIIDSNCHDNAKNGGYIWVTKNTSVINCNFYNNTGSQGGCVIHQAEDTRFTGCNFYNNTDNGAFLILCWSPDVSMKNCNYYNNGGSGISLLGPISLGPPYFVATNCKSYNNKVGISFSQVINNTITGCSIYDNVDYGIQLGAGTSGNLIYNNYFDNVINAYDDGNNIWNISKNAGTNILGDPYLGGNYWSDYDGKDLDSDGLGDTLLPYNCGGNITNGGDFLPLVPLPRQVHNLDTGLDYLTIQAAIDALETLDGHTILVDAGTYNEEISIDKSVTLNGAQANVPIVDGVRAGDESIIRGKGNGSYGYSWCVIRIKHSDVVINGFTIDNGQRDIAIQGSLSGHEGISNIQISYNYIKDTGTKSSNSGVFRDNAAADVTIDHNYIASNPNGIKTNGGATTITNNTFYHNGHGIDFQGGDPYDKYFPDYAEPNYPTVIRDNTFTDDSTSIYLRLDKCHQSITITGNDITEARNDAIRTWNVYDIDIVNPSIHYNNIVDSTNFGINNPVTAVNLNATCNWWGHATGANHSSNPHGTGQDGDAVSDNVDFIPWYATSTTTPSTEYVTVNHNPVIAVSDTIQGGIDAAVAGDTVTVAPGTYNENVIVNKSLTVKGEDKNTTTIQSVLEGGMYGTYGDRVVIIEASDVTISNLTISGYTGTEEKPGSTSWAIYADGEYTNIKVVDNILTFYTQGGIRFLDVKDSLIEDNVFKKETRLVWYDPPGATPGSYVDKTYGGSGPELWDCLETDVLGNKIEEANIGVFIQGSTNTTIQGNIISARCLADAGIHVQGATNTEIKNNIISNFENGPKTGYTHGIKGAGIYVISNDVTIENNDITENSVGIYVMAREGNPSPTNVVANNNNIESNSDYGVLNIKFPALGSWNYWDYQLFLPADAVVDAKLNWWGHLSGPYHATNPNGQGDNVSDYVNYIPWLDAPYPGGNPTSNPPVISNIVADPESQVVDGFVNITCDVSDDLGVATVKVNISGPVGFVALNETMNDGSYYYNRSYDIVGQYSFSIWANDTSGNEATSDTYQFEIIDICPPEIMGVTLLVSDPIDTEPDFGWENFSCTVIDNVAVSHVKLVVTDSNVTTEYLMTKIGTDTYYYNTTLTDAGDYTYHIWADDFSGNNATSTPDQTFLLPENWEMNTDRKCDISDLRKVALQFGETGPDGWIRADYNNNGVCDISDLRKVALEFGATY